MIFKFITQCCLSFLLIFAICKEIRQLFLRAATLINAITSNRARCGFQLNISSFSFDLTISIFVILSHQNMPNKYCNYTDLLFIIFKFYGCLTLNNLNDSLRFFSKVHWKYKKGIRLMDFRKRRCEKTTEFRCSPNIDI